MAFAIQVEHFAAFAPSLQVAQLPWHFTQASADAPNHPGIHSQDPGEIPLTSLAPSAGLHVRHLSAPSSLHVAQVEWQSSQLSELVFGKYLASQTQTPGGVVTVALLQHVKQLLAPRAEQVSHVASHVHIGVASLSIQRYALVDGQSAAV
ncbi:MAG: hypothetical protein V2I33_18930 [Kangiellaceae bacterium]|nr:hypothetical protein [Kangiellaceae bacterium]